MNEPLPPFREDTAAEAQQVEERRRPGRPAHVSPALLPLLRRDSLLNTSPGRGPDDLAAVRGVVASVLIGTLVWAAIAAGVYWLLLR